MLSVHPIETEDEWDELRGPWNDLVLATGDSSPFFTFEWQRTWWKHFGGRRRLLVLAIRDGGEVSGIVPWCVRWIRQGRTPFRKIEFIGTGLSDRLDFMLRDRPREQLELVREYIAGRRIGWDLVDLSEVPDTSPGLAAWRELAADQGTPHRAAISSVCPYLTIEGDWEAFFQGRFDGKDRRRLRNLEKNLARHGTPAVRIITDIRSEPDMIGRLATIARGGHYRGRRRQGLFADPPKRRFFEEISDTFSALGWLHLSVLEVSGRLAAYRYGFQKDGRYFDYFPDHDAELGPCAPGRILLTHLMEDCFRRRFHEYDFLRGDEPYKYEWTGEERRNLRMTVFRPSLCSPLLRLAYSLMGLRRPAASRSRPRRRE